VDGERLHAEKIKRKGAKAQRFYKWKPWGQRTDEKVDLR
jgi:hypothetical protein